MPRAGDLTGDVPPSVPAAPELARHEPMDGGQAAMDMGAAAVPAAAPVASGGEGGPRLSADDGSFSLLEWNFDDAGGDGGGGGELDDDDASVATADIVQDMMFDAGVSVVRCS